MRIRDRILVFLASRGSKCATLNEIMGLLKPYYHGKNLRSYTLKMLHKMARAKQIRRSWIWIGNRKRRLYCLRLGE